MSVTSLRFCRQCLATEHAEARQVCGACGIGLKPLTDQAGAMSRDYLAARGSCCRSGCRNCPYPKAKTCQRCGAQFDCGMNGCWCANVRLEPEALRTIRQAYSDCLCPTCLNSLS